MARPEMTPEQQAWMEEQLEDLDLVYVGFHGSHLYGLEREGSDIDIKAVYLPPLEEVLVGKVAKTVQRSCAELDIEIEIKSMPNFLYSCDRADTNCIDLLHSSEDMKILSTKVWEDLVKLRKSMYAKNMRGVVGYIKVHTNKYTNKLTRLSEMKVLLELVDNLLVVDPEFTVKDLCESSEFTDIDTFKHISTTTLVKDHEQQYLEVCGKKYIFTWNLGLLKTALEKEVSRYGSRSSKGLEVGLDTKALSHALRVLLQLKEILREGDLVFPLKEASFVRDVKEGKVTDIRVVLGKIDTLYEECMKLIEESSLQDEIDISSMVKIVKECYLGK